MIFKIKLYKLPILIQISIIGLVLVRLVLFASGTILEFLILLFQNAFSDEYIILVVLILFSIRALFGSFSTSYQQNVYLQVRMGSFFSAFNAKPFHLEFLCFIWSANYINNILIPCLFKLKHFKWAFIVLWVEKKISDHSIGKF